MQEQTSTQDLKDRLALIESMMTEGRRTTESWGWTFLLWGVAYYIAIAWYLLGHSNLAWPVTMIAAVIVTVIVVSMRASKKPETTMGRAVGSVWIALGISMFLLFFSFFKGNETAHCIQIALPANGFFCRNQRVNVQKSKLTISQSGYDALLSNLFMTSNASDLVQTIQFA